MKRDNSLCSLKGKAQQDRSWVSTKLLLDHSVVQMKREIRQLEKKITAQHTKVEQAQNYIVSIKEELNDSEKNYRDTAQGGAEDFILETLKQKGKKSPYWFKKAQESEKTVQKRKEMAKKHLKFTQDTLAQAQLVKKEAEQELQELEICCAEIKQRCIKIEQQARQVREVEKELLSEGVVKGVNEIDCLIAQLSLSKVKSNELLLRAPRINRK